MNFSDRDVVSFPSPIQICVDKASQIIRIVLDTNIEFKMYELAKGLWVGRTANDEIGEIVVAGVVWI